MARDALVKIMYTRAFPHLTPLTSRLPPLAYHLTPLTSRLSSLTPHLSPLAPLTPHPFRRYARLFDWIVVRVNKTTDVSGDTSDRYIGLLDVYGFEFFDVNSFEQLCINFANEMLQQFFLVSVFASEANTYNEEGVPWTPIQFEDNSHIIKLCEEKEKVTLLHQVAFLPYPTCSISHAPPDPYSLVPYSATPLHRASTTF